MIDDSISSRLLGWTATFFALLLTGLATWWRGRLRVRQDARNDKEAADVAEGYSAINRQYRTRIDELVRDVAQLRSEFDQMRMDRNIMREERDQARQEIAVQLRRAEDAESKVARLTARIGPLEDQVHELQAQVALLKSRA